MNAGKRSIAVLWNDAAGWDAGDQAAQDVQQTLATSDVDLRFCRIHKGDDIISQTRDLVSRGSTVVVAAGGDGTVNAVASALVNTPSALAVIPAGTLNHFARDLSIPLQPLAAAASIRDGREILVDVGCVNKHIFINNSVLGLYPVYRAAREAYERRGLGSNSFLRFFAVMRGILRTLWQFPHLELSLQTADGRMQRVQTPFVLIANNEHELEQWNIGHRKAINKGILWVYVMRRCSRWTAVRFLLAFVFKRFSRHDAFNIYAVRQLTVQSRSRLPRVGVDGEIVRLESPLHYQSMPRSLRVIAPAGYQAEEGC
jgi:diacylglycerol kinase family enzyme